MTDVKVKRDADDRIGSRKTREALRYAESALADAREAMNDALVKRETIGMERNDDFEPPLYAYRIDICHLVALKMRNDEMLRGSFHGLSRTYLRNSKMIQSRLETLIMKMKSSPAPGSSAVASEPTLTLL